ncbi:hypothetical protein BG000_006203 [Podila horticola]|nr:hypothetical protein BG000_006203 [Podila horticola]
MCNILAKIVFASLAMYINRQHSYTFQKNILINMRFSIIAVALATAASMVQAAPTSVKRSGAVAQGSAANSPGWGSGNVLNIPIAAPINGCGNSVNWIGGLNNAEGNACVGH